MSEIEKASQLDGQSTLRAVDQVHWQGGQLKLSQDDVQARRPLRVFDLIRQHSGQAVDTEGEFAIFARMRALPLYFALLFCAGCTVDREFGTSGNSGGRGEPGDTGGSGGKGNGGDDGSGGLAAGSGGGGGITGGSGGITGGSGGITGGSGGITGGSGGQPAIPMSCQEGDPHCECDAEGCLITAGGACLDQTDCRSRICGVNKNSDNICCNNDCGTGDVCTLDGTACELAPQCTDKDLRCNGDYEVCTNGQWQVSEDCQGRSCSKAAGGCLRPAGSECTLDGQCDAGTCHTTNTETNICCTASCGSCQVCSSGGDSCEAMQMIPQSCQCTTGMCVYCDTSSNRCWTTTDSVVTYDQQSARSYCSSLSLEGYAAWRAPSRDEVATITLGCTAAQAPCPVAQGPGLSGNYWPISMGNTLTADDGLWTAEDGYAWVVARGALTTASPTSALQVRCVTDGP